MIKRATVNRSNSTSKKTIRAKLKVRIHEEQYV